MIDRMIKLTKKYIDSLKPQEKAYIIWDSDLKGFGLKVHKSGRKTYLIKYRNQYNQQRKPTIGDHGKVTPDQARTQAKQLFAQVAQGGDPSQEKHTTKHSMTMTELCDKFIHDYCAVRIKPSTMRDYKAHVARYIKPNFGKMKVTAVQRCDIAKLHHAYQHTPYVANRTLANLSKMFNLAEEWGYRDEHTNPCRFIKKYSENKRDRFLSQQELATLGQVLKDAERNQTETLSVINAIKLLLFTGCRLNEILSLKWEYIDQEYSCFRLPDSKTGAKAVYYAQSVQEILNKIEKVPHNPYVIIGKNEGQHLNNLQKPWTRIRTLANITDVRLHDLRHSFASIGVLSGLSLPIIGGLLGHSQTQTTARYAHVSGDLRIQASTMINNKILEAMNATETANIMTMQ